MTSSFVRFEILDVLQGRGLKRAEVYLKSGRSRRFVMRYGDVEVHSAEERGWSARAGDERCSFFKAGTGWPTPDEAWPEPDGYPLELPARRDVPPWRPPSNLEAPLAGERDGIVLLQAIQRAVETEAGGVRLSLALLEDGASDSVITSSEGIDASWRDRVASIRLEAVDHRDATTASVVEVAREARDLRPDALARALVDRMSVAKEGTAADRDRGDMVLSPEVAAHLLRGLLPLLVGPEAVALAASLADRAGRLGSPLLTIVDDGRHADGLLAAAVDGEGVPTRGVVLVDEGNLRQPLLAWWQDRDPDRISGCSRRPSWRDLPSPSPSHLFVQPRADVPARDLVAAVSRGYYLLSTNGAGRFELDAGRFALPVSGFAIEGGAARRPVGRAWLCGTVGTLLRGVQAVARDLHFVPFDGMIGSPSLLVTGLELRSTP